MNVEQRAYIKMVVGNPANDFLFNQFITDASLSAKVKAFERTIEMTWNQFLRDHYVIRPSEFEAEVYRKVQFPDFGENASNPAPVLKKYPLLEPIEKISPVSHPSQAIGSVLASSGSSQASPDPSAPSPAALPTTGSPFASSIGTSNTKVAPNTFGATPTTPSPATPPAPSSSAIPSKEMTASEPPKSAPRPTIRFTIRNARQNESFEGEIVRDPNTPGLRLLDVKLPESSGLTVDREHWRITGTPAIAGELNLGLRYAFANGPAQVSHTAGMPFVINADPQTLWRNLDSDRTSPFWKEDSAASIILGNDARIVAARQRGRSHAHKGTCCDDDYSLLCDDKNGWHFAVVADGAGSAKFSRRGSQVATRAVTSFMKEVFADQRGAGLTESIEEFAQRNTLTDTPPEVLDQAQQKIQVALFTTIGYAAHAAVRELHAEMKSQEDIITSIKDLSTTLLIGLSRKVGKRWFCAAYWVGDGAIAVYRRNQSVQLLGAPDSGEFSGQTCFLDASQVNQESLMKRIDFGIFEDMTAFLLMTDGVSDPKFPSEVAMGQVEEWDRLWDEIEAEVRLSDDEDGLEARLLDWLDFWAQGEYDDRTLAIIY